LDLPRSVKVEFNDAIRLQVLEHSTESFWEGLGYLKTYKAEHGDCRVPSEFKTNDGYALGWWLGSRRSEYRMGVLTQERIDALDALAVIWDELEHDFQEGLNRLAAYKAECGHVRVHANFKTEDGYNLGSWASSRRTNYRRGVLTQERIDALGALGFIWDAPEEKFQEGLSHLSAYKTEFGHCKVPNKFKTDDGYRLGGWVGRCRRFYRNGRLSQERADALGALGFVWDQLDEDFQEGLTYLKAYKTEHGHLRVLQNFKTEEGHNLGTWVGSRRADYKKGVLTQERIDALGALGFIWDQLEESFQTGLGYLSAYKAEHGDCVVPATFKAEDGFALGSWCAHRRTDYKNGKLSQERIDVLKALGFDL